MKTSDFLNAMFVDKQQWHRLSDEDKVSCAFFMNRIMARKFPDAAEALNKKSVNQAAAMDVWFNSLRNVKGVPPWARFVPDKRPDAKMAKYLEVNGIRQGDLVMLQKVAKSEIADDLDAYSELYDAQKDETFFKKSKISKKK